MTVNIFYPSNDGETQEFNFGAGSGVSLDTLRGGPGTHFQNGNSVMRVGLNAGVSNLFGILQRSIVLFNTTSLAGTILSGVLRLVPWAVAGPVTGLGDTSVEIVSSNPASDSAIAASDFTTLGSVSFGSLDISDMAGDVDQDFVLNAAGLAALAPGAITKLGMILGWDLNASFTGAYVDNEVTRVYFHASEEAGSTKDPKLTITTLDTFKPRTVVST